MASDICIQYSILPRVGANDHCLSYKSAQQRWRELGLGVYIMDVKIAGLEGMDLFFHFMKMESFLQNHILDTLSLQVFLRKMQSTS